MNNNWTTLRKIISQKHNVVDDKIEQLQTLELSYNQLTNLPVEIGNLAQLRTLSLSHNQLTNLPVEIGNLTLLQTLFLHNNQLTNIPVEIGNLTQLRTLYLVNNQLTNLPVEIGNLTLLQTLYLHNNKLTNLPICIIHLPNLSSFTYHNNEITNLHPAITRWLNRSKTTQNVYSNSQSVHDHNIESTTNASIIKFVSGHQIKQVDVFDLVDGFSISPKTKNLLKSYCESDYIHSNLKLTFKEVALPVLDYIDNHDDKPELLKILDDEIKESESKCFQGRLSRLINVINGYHPSVNVNISDNEQIGNIAIMLKKLHNGINLDKLIDLFIKEMNERSYKSDIIDEWVEHIKENY